MPFETIKKIREKYSDYLVDLEWIETLTEVSLLSICINKKDRKKGIGRDVMNDILTYCEKNNKNISLISANGSYKQRKMLENFYQDILGMERYYDPFGCLCYKKTYRNDN